MREWKGSWMVKVEGVRPEIYQPPVGGGGEGPLVVKGSRNAFFLVEEGSVLDIGRGEGGFVEGSMPGTELMLPKRKGACISMQGKGGGQKGKENEGEGKE